MPIVASLITTVQHSVSMQEPPRSVFEIQRCRAWDEARTQAVSRAAGECMRDELRFGILHGDGGERCGVQREGERAFIVCPNPASENLHKKMGFVLAGHYHRIGYKFGKWRDIEFYEMELNKEEPTEIIPYTMFIN